jgi:DNA-binding Lrp family transcriptional regulator
LRWKDDSLLRDDLDRKIVALLVENGRASYAQVGAEVGLSTPAVKRRVDRLVAEGVITGFTALVDPEALGGSTEAFVELHCKSRTDPEEIRSMVGAFPEVVGAYTITGDADALLHVQTPSTRALESVIERIRAHRNAERTNSRIVLSRLVHRPTA